MNTAEERPAVGTSRFVRPSLAPRTETCGRPFESRQVYAMTVPPRPGRGSIHSPWAGVKAGRYPKPVKLGPRITAWRVEDIRTLIEKPQA